MLAPVELPETRRVGGLSASMYLLIVSLWVPSSFAIALSLACCAAFHPSLWRKVGFRGVVELSWHLSPPCR